MTTQSAAWKHNVLLVEDNPGDVRLVREALRDHGDRVDLHVAESAESATAFLKEARGDGLPDLVLLDLKLPGLGGRDILRFMKGDATLRHIPVVVLTSSAAESDVTKAYDLGANCYVTKPVELDDYVRVVRMIHTFWLDIAMLPPSGAALQA